MVPTAPHPVDRERWMSLAPPSSPFLIPQPEAPASPALRLICLPFAGGGAGVYRRWAEAAPPGVEVWPLQLPGRERRLTDRPYTSMVRLVDDLHQTLGPWLDTAPWAIFGHSMGAAIAHAWALTAAEALMPPAHLFLSARRAPAEPRPHPPLFALSDEALLDQVQALYGPLPAVLRDRPHLVKLFLPTLRADIQLLDTWSPPTERRLDLPVTALACADDPAVAPEQVARWAEVTSGPFAQVTVPGDHFHEIREGHALRDAVMARLADYSSRVTSR